MENEVVNILIVMALSTTKFLGGIIAGLYHEWGFPLFYLSTVLGGMIGVIAYDLLLLEVMDFYRRWRGKEKPKPKINRKTRRLALLRAKFGLIGVAILTPIILQVPVGTILAGSIEPNARKVVFYMFLSFSFYAILFYGLYHYAGFSPKVIFEYLQFWK